MSVIFYKTIHENRDNKLRNMYILEVRFICANLISGGRFLLALQSVQLFIVKTNQRHDTTNQSGLFKQARA